MSLEALRAEILKKARAKADAIIKSAEEEAKKILDEAMRDYSRRYELVREAELRELRDELSKKLSEKNLEVSTRLLNLKNELIKELIEEVLNKIKEVNDAERRNSLKKLITECLNELHTEQKINVGVVERDASLIKDVLRELGIEDRIKEIKILPPERVGGVLVELENGSFTLDNTYTTRLERLLSIIYKKLNDEVFGG
ncbi:MAG: V-type ATP synthase subunit E family protein [Desulfurococcaceae archaeon TW002]